MRESITEQVPQREWLLRCQDPHGDVAVCSIGVAAGDIEVAGPGEQAFFRLQPWEIASFRKAFDEAISVAEADLAKR